MWNAAHLPLTAMRATRLARHACLQASLVTRGDTSTQVAVPSDAHSSPAKAAAAYLQQQPTHHLACTGESLTTGVTILQPVQQP